MNDDLQAQLRAAWNRTAAQSQPPRPKAPQPDPDNDAWRIALRLLAGDPGWPGDALPDLVVYVIPASPATACRCGSATWRDVAIHDGQSVRRDCDGCGRFLDFPVWYGATREPRPVPDPGGCPQRCDPPARRMRGL